MNIKYRLKAGRMNYLVIIEKGKNNFSAYCPDVPGCDLYQQGEPLPKPQSLKSHIEEFDIQAGDMFTFVQVDVNIMSEAA